MKLLRDTQVLLWVALGSPRLRNEARAMLEDSGNTPFLSVASRWEIAISGEHAVCVSALPAIHRDPFDRMLLAQARTEGMVLLTADRKLAKYAGPVRLV